MEKWKSWAIGIGAGWILLAFIAWNYESTCGMFLNGSCFSLYWDSIRQIVLLKWVDSYQNLLGSFIALGAGVFVLMGAKITVRENTAAEHRKTRSSAIFACSVVANEFNDIYHQFRYSDLISSPKVDSDKYFRLSANYIPHIFTINHNIGILIFSVKQEIELYIPTGNSYDYLQQTRMKYHCVAAAYILRHISENLSHDGTFIFDEQKKIPGKNLEEECKRIGLRIVTVKSDFPLFDWSK